MVKRLSPRNILFGLWLFLFPLFAGLVFWPINTSFVRLSTLAVIALILLGIFYFSWRQRVLFLSSFAFLTLALIFLLLPGNPQVDLAKLQTKAASEMIGFQDVPYVWGGESRFGIDCSGLIRKSFQNVLLKEGIRTLNPFLIRGAIDLWWNDATAAKIGEGYDGRTQFIVSGRSLNSLDHTQLEVGDLAVTASGVHILAYLGDNRWINADPAKSKVTIFQIPDSSNAWSLTPIKIIRWNQIQG